MHAFVHCTYMHEEIHGSLWHVDYSVLHRAVRIIACELYVVERSVSRVTSRWHTFVGLFTEIWIYTIVGQKINKQWENTLEFLCVGLV